MSGYYPDCGNTQCICKEVERQEGHGWEGTTMTDTEMIDRVAELWISLGGDAEGMAYAWVRLRDAVQRKMDGLEDE